MSQSKNKNTSRKRSALTPEQVVAHFTKKFQEHEFESLVYTPEQYFAAHLYMVTMNVDRQSQKPVTQPLEIAGKWYFQLLRKLLGHSVHKQSAQPLAYAFVDFEGSKTGSNSMTGAHVHAMILIEPDKQKADFDKLRADADLTFGLEQVTDIQIDPFRVGKKTSTEVVSYAMKGYMQTSDVLSNKHDLWRVMSEQKPSLPKKRKKKTAKAIRR